jgi:hypothetical protein
VTLPRSSPAALAVLLLLAGCPLPQSVPSVPSGSIPPPRIVADVSAPPATPSFALTTAGTTVPFDPGCATGQIFQIAATIADENYSEAVDYRWFLDYDPNTGVSPPGYVPLWFDQLLPPSGEPYTRRQVPTQPFQPLFYGNTMHVLELVVSNGFDVCPPDPSHPQPLPCRTPQTTPNRYEVQSYKWVFVPVPGCTTAPATCPPCP